MKTLTYTIKDKLGIHARPAGDLVAEAKKYQSEIMIDKNGESISLKRLMALMKLGVKCGETVTVTFEGSDEEKAFEAIKEFFAENL